MPREQINYPSTVNAIVDGISPANEWKGDGEPEHGQVTYEYVEPRLHVNWLKVDDFGAGHVQLSIETHPQDIVSRVDDAQKIIDRNKFDETGGNLQVLDPNPSIWLYTPPLSREEINKLIRVLRKARDNVFEADE